MPLLPCIGLLYPEEEGGGRREEGGGRREEGGGRREEGGGRREEGGGRREEGGGRREEGGGRREGRGGRRKKGKKEERVRIETEAGFKIHVPLQKTKKQFGTITGLKLQSTSLCRQQCHYSNPLTSM